MVGDKIPALRINKLGKSFKNVKAVNEISLTIEQGEIFGLLGPNGAGKSTTINMISGVSRVGVGKIEIFGHDNQIHYSVTRRMTGVVHQEMIIDNFLPIGRSLQIHSGYYGVLDDPVWRDLLVERLSLKAHLGKTMIQLSGGMKRRFMIAKALVHRPPLLILDEPTAGVDVELRRTLWDFVHEINKQGTTILLTTHYLEEAEQMCNRIAVMNHGDIIALEKTSDLIRNLGTLELCCTFHKTIKPAKENFPGIPFSTKENLQENSVTVNFKILEDKKIGEILDIIHNQGWNIQNLRTRQTSLEDVFVQLTKNTSQSGAHVNE